MDLLKKEAFSKEERNLEPFLIEENYSG